MPSGGEISQILSRNCPLREIRNPNDEIRRKSETRMTNDANPLIRLGLWLQARLLVPARGFRSLNIRISFGFRHSDFGIP